METKLISDITPGELNRLRNMYHMSRSYYIEYVTKLTKNINRIPRELSLYSTEDAEKAFLLTGQEVFEEIRWLKASRMHDVNYDKLEKIFFPDGMPIYIDLKPCPFCGGDADMSTVRYSEEFVKEQGWEQSKFYYCSCTICLSNSQGLVGQKSMFDASEKWNKRYGK